MDSLLANYASSDEEEQDQHHRPIPSVPSKPSSEIASSNTSSFFSSLPKPNSSSLFQSLPQPKQTPNSTNSLIPEHDSEPPSKTSKVSGSTSFFSSLPKPKSQIEQESLTRVSSSGPSTKKVVQFRPPVIPLAKSRELDDDDDEDDRETEENRRKMLESVPQTPSVKSFLSSIPAPRNTATLGVQSTSGSGRRSIIEADVPASSADGSAAVNNYEADQNAASYGNYENYGNYQYGTDPNSGYYMGSDSYGNYSSGIDHSMGTQSEAVTAGNDTSSSYYVNNDTYASYNTYGGYGQYGNNWADGSGAAVQEISGISDNGLKVSGKRGRNEIPSEVIEVKQEELIKNRPREDQVKLTGIAFGPSYQVIMLACFFSVFSCQGILSLKCY